MHMWLTLPDELRADHLEARAVRRATSAQVLERRDFVFVGGYEQLSTAGMWNAVKFAEPEEPLSTFDAEPCLERPRWIVDAGMNHAAVVRAHPAPDARVALEHADACSAFGKSQRARQTDDAASDYSKFDFSHAPGARLTSPAS